MLDLDGREVFGLPVVEGVVVDRYAPYVRQRLTGRQFPVDRSRYSSLVEQADRDVRNLSDEGGLVQVSLDFMRSRTGLRAVASSQSIAPD